MTGATLGGGYRYVLRLDTGNEFAFSGKYTEVTHSRLVYTQVFEPTASGAIIASGMEHGMRETMDQLEGLVAALR